MSEDHGQDGGRDTLSDRKPGSHGKRTNGTRANGKADSAKGRLLNLADYEIMQTDRVLGEMRGYWEGLRQGRAIPARADVEPSGIRRALDYAFILERIAPGAARFRLAGKHLIDLMGMEVRGMPLCSFLDTSSRGRLSDVLESVFRGPQIAELVLESPAAYGRPGLTGRMLFLPLRSDLGDVTRALGCLVSEGEIGQGPRRFDLISDEVFPVIPGAKLIEPSASAFAFNEAPARYRPQSEAPATPSPAPPPLADDASPQERRASFRIISTDP